MSFKKKSIGLREAAPDGIPLSVAGEGTYRDHDILECAFSPKFGIRHQFINRVAVRYDDQDC